MRFSYANLEIVSKLQVFIFSIDLLAFDSSIYISFANNYIIDSKRISRFTRKLVHNVLFASRHIIYDIPKRSGACSNYESATQKLYPKNCLVAVHPATECRIKFELFSAHKIDQEFSAGVGRSWKQSACNVISRTTQSIWMSLVWCSLIDRFFITRFNSGSLIDVARFLDWFILPHSLFECRRKITHERDTQITDALNVPEKKMSSQLARIIKFRNDCPNFGAVCALF